MLSFPVVFVSSARESDRNRINMAKRGGDFRRWKRGLFNLDREKKKNLTIFLIESPDFFSVHWSPDFPLLGVGRSEPCDSAREL